MNDGRFINASRMKVVHHGGNPTGQKMKSPFSETTHAFDHLIQALTVYPFHDKVWLTAQFEVVHRARYVSGFEEAHHVISALQPSRYAGVAEEFVFNGLDGNL